MKKITIGLMLLCSVLSYGQKSSEKTDKVRRVVVVRVPYDIATTPIRKTSFASDTIYVKETRKECKIRLRKLKLSNLIKSYQNEQKQ